MGQRQFIVHRERAKETRIQNSIIWDDRLSTAARFSLIAMLSLPETWDYSVRGMAVMLGISKDTMSKYLRELEAVKYLKRMQPHSGQGKFSKAEYILTDTPGVFGDEGDGEPCPKKSDTDAPPCPNLSAPEKSPQKKRTEEKNEKKPTKKNSPGADVLFDRFWNAYPKKKGKEAARRAWTKLSPDMSLCRVMAKALDRQRQSQDWQREEGRYIPYPASWLNGRRWEDEPDKPGDPEPPEKKAREFEWH